MFIKLTPRAAFWSLVDPITRKLIVHLTFQKPGPVEVNFNKLNKHCKQIVNAGLEYGNIMQTRDTVTKKKAPELDPKVEEEKKKGTEDHRVSSQKINIESFLEQGVRGIRDQLRDNDYGSEDLSRAIELEKAGANRKTVLSSLEQKFNKVGGASVVVDKDEEQIEIQLT
jgi:hypothetical protein